MRKHQDCHTLLRLHFFEKLDRSDLFWLLPGSSCTSSGFIPGDSNGFFVSLCNSTQTDSAVKALQSHQILIQAVLYILFRAQNDGHTLMHRYWRNIHHSAVPEIIPMDAQEVRQRYPDTNIILCIWRKVCVCVSVYVCTYVYIYITINVYLNVCRCD